MGPSGIYRPSCAPLIQHEPAGLPNRGWNGTTGTFWFANVPGASTLACRLMKELSQEEYGYIFHSRLKHHPIRAEPPLFFSLFLWKVLTERALKA